MKHSIAALAALALAAAPAAAAAAPPPLAPASEHIEGSELRGAVYWLLPVLVIVALLIAMSAGDDSNATPLSP
jgi:hypothetical protein